MRTLLIVRRAPGSATSSARWVRSYVLDREDGLPGPVSIYETRGP